MWGIAFVIACCQIFSFAIFHFIVVLCNLPCDIFPILSIEDADVVIFASVNTVQKVAEDFQFLCVEICIYTIVVADDFSLLVCEIILGCEHVAEAIACCGDVPVDEVDNIANSIDRV